MEICVVITAGGSGTRIGGVPKQFRLLGGKSVLQHTVEVFVRWASECHIVVVAPRGNAGRVQSMMETTRAAASVVEGGATRQESVLNGLRLLRGKGAPPETVTMIHDAVRPFVDAALLDRVVAACVRSGAAAPAVAVSDTIRSVRDGWFAETVSRDDLYRMQTPQAFALERILEAHEHSASDGIDATDDVEVYLRSGGRVEFVEGSSANIKITTTADLELAELQMDRRNA